MGTYEDEEMSGGKPARVIPETPGYTAPNGIHRQHAHMIETGIKALQIVMHERSSKSGWWNDQKTGERFAPDEVSFYVPTKLCLIHSEISEAMEGHRTNAMDDKLPHRTMLECELADAMIRIADLAEVLHLDLGGAIIEKSNYNVTRKDHTEDARSKPGGKRY